MIDELEARENQEADLGSPPTEPGITLMTRPDLEAAIGLLPIGPGDGDGDATSREEGVRKQMLSRYRDDPDLLWRRCLIANDATLTRLRHLERGAGNMTTALEIVRRAAVVSHRTGMQLQVPPLVLNGPPGTGKSRVAAMIASALGTTSTTIFGSSVQDAGPIVGYGTAWRGAGPGAIAKALIACPTASPVVVIDEAEKCADVDRRSHPLDVLLPMMEQTTAKRFCDAYLSVPMRADHIVWVLCTNDLGSLSAPLLDRCVVVDVPELTGDARRRAIEELVADVVLDHAIAPAPLDAESLTVLDRLGFRRLRAVVSAALANALEDGRDWPNADDLREAVELIDAGSSRRTQRRPAGFIHF